MTFLFESTIFGPVKSRRLGNSLGINLLPNNRKVCNYNCIYCECGLTMDFDAKGQSLPSREEVKQKLKSFLEHAKENNTAIDTITFAGNGEPSLHPEFQGIISDVIELRKQYFPEVKIAVLSNATLIHKTEIFDSLSLADLNILKLDSAIDKTIQLINCPNQNISANELIDKLMEFKGNLIIQTLFLKGTYNNKAIDNTSDKEINAWLNALRNIGPKQVMIYTFSRSTPFQSLEKITPGKLNEIGNRVKNLGIDCIISA